MVIGDQTEWERTCIPRLKGGPEKNKKTIHNDMVRFEIMDKFGYYVTESSEHNTEYHPYFIKRLYPELIERYNIPLDDIKRCELQIKS